MSYTLVIKEEAIEDAAAIYRWYEDKKHGLGRRFEMDLDGCYDRIEENPYLFQIRQDPFRKAHLDIYPCSVAFEIDEPRKEAIIYAVMGQKDDPEKLALRLKQSR